jgi:DNA mismatch endonuclease (patch repair protein)
VADTVDKATRSRYMAAVKSHGNRSTEVRMVALLRANQLKGWRRRYPLPGSPDFCWPRQKIALFVDGCFWHGCPRCYKTPKSNVAYWRKKVEDNRAHDRRTNATLRRSGWAVVRVWECRIQEKRTASPIGSILRRRGWTTNERDIKARAPTRRGRTAESSVHPERKTGFRLGPKGRAQSSSRR